MSRMVRVDEELWGLVESFHEKVKSQVGDVPRTKSMKIMALGLREMGFPDFMDFKRTQNGKREGKFEFGFKI